MTIVDIQRRLRELARIRIGDQAATSSGGRRPRKLEAFRITSRDEAFVRAAAERYGGEARPWAAPDGQQWEVYTTARELPVVVPPTDMAFSQAYQLWSAGGCQRRCDGAYETIGDQACVCDPEKRQCAITTRLSVILHELPGLGVCRLETHGFYAAVELGGAVDLVNSAFTQGRLLPARLLLEQRQVKRAGKDGKPQTRNFVVPCLDFPMSFGALQQAASPAGEVGGGAMALVAPTPSFTPVPVAELPEAPTASPAEQLAAGQQGRAPKPRSNGAEPIRPTGRSHRRAVEVAGGDPAPLPGDGGAAGSEPVAAVSDPAPPDDEEQGATLPLVSRVAIWIGELQPPDDMSADEFRHAFLAVFSDGEYASAKQVPADGETIERLRAAIARYRQGSIRLVAKNGAWCFVDRSSLPTNDPAGEHQRGPTPPVREYSKMKVAELAEECRNRGIEPAGTRAQLIALLEAA